MSKNKNMDKASERKRMMKKLITLLFLPLFLACQKETAPEDDMVTVSFLPQIESGNILTRSQFSDEVLDNLEYLMPKYIYLYSSKDGMWSDSPQYTLNIEENNQFSIQKGNYILEASSGKYEQCNPSVNTGIPLVAGWETVSKYFPSGSDPRYHYRVRRITIDESRQYDLPLYISGILFACKKSDASYFKYGNYSCQETENYYYYIITLGLAYESHKFSFGMGETENYEKTTITDTWKKEDCGKYYILRPNEKEFHSFNISINNGGWIPGNEE